MNHKSVTNAPHAAIVAESVTKTFDSFTAIRDVSLCIRPGTMFALLGPNGSGKSTLLKLLTGLLSASEGSLFINGIEFNNANSIAIKRMIGVLPESLGLFDNLTLWEHLLMAGALYKIESSEAKSKSRELLEYLDLWRQRQTYAGNSSFGMRKKTALAMALLHNPTVLFLDEPLEGIDPVSTQHIWQLMDRLATKGTTIFMTSHMIDMVEHSIEEFAIISQGSIVHSSTMADVAALGSSLKQLYFKYHGRSEARELAWLGS